MKFYELCISENEINVIENKIILQINIPNIFLLVYIIIIEFFPTCIYFLNMYNQNFIQTYAKFPQ